jgi:hypothetical protein
MEYSKRGECDARGKEGEHFLATKLEAALEGTGLRVRIASEDDIRAPLDIEVLDGDMILVGIENKDLCLGTTTRIDRLAKRRKQEHARVNGIPKLLTTVTLREVEQIGFRRGIENKPVASYDFSLEHLVQEIVSTKREA